MSIICIVYAIVGGFLMPAPDDTGILAKTIRNLHYHVPMWFTMIILLMTSYVYSIKYLSKGDLRFDNLSGSFAKVSMLFDKYLIL